MPRTADHADGPAYFSTTSGPLYAGCSRGFFVKALNAGEIPFAVRHGRKFIARAAIDEWLAPNADDVQMARQ
jgi:hypothetical protein